MTRTCAFCADPEKLTEQRREEMHTLLAERREHLPLWHAYGQQLYKAGQAKVVFYSCCVYLHRLLNFKVFLQTGHTPFT